MRVTRLHRMTTPKESREKKVAFQLIENLNRHRTINKLSCIGEDLAWAIETVRNAPDSPMVVEAKKGVFQAPRTANGVWTPKGKEKLVKHWKENPDGSSTSKKKRKRQPTEKEMKNAEDRIVQLLMKRKGLSEEAARKLVT